MFPNNKVSVCTTVNGVLLLVGIILFFFGPNPSTLRCVGYAIAALSVLNTGILAESKSMTIFGIVIAILNTIALIAQLYVL